MLISAHQPCGTVPCTHGNCPALLPGHPRAPHQVCPEPFRGCMAPWSGSSCPAADLLQVPSSCALPHGLGYDSLGEKICPSPPHRQCPGILGIGTWPEPGNVDTKPELSAQTPNAALASAGAILLQVPVGVILILLQQQPPAHGTHQAVDLGCQQGGSGCASWHPQCSQSSDRQPQVMFPEETLWAEGMDGL